MILAYYFMKELPFAQEEEEEEQYIRSQPKINCRSIVANCSLTSMFQQI